MHFGISTGKQDSQSVCGFVFNSTERTNGSFTSPNYPVIIESLSPPVPFVTDRPLQRPKPSLIGLYPRDTECHYFFYGNASQKVYITFAYFDVEGVTPISNYSQSL
ncbi:unnamed protein product [Medioppia subpectinata]|uniref:CUB domain-containing protein n=1 Tax=Medioppia subpectinata TaxID=1979941 RepID=A0A7R9KKF2_9ACAR|nr:unnamed protein product [Medioppia subpectinata]CAG2104867.1 unnamed protein product [Medioppia subpectinata]